MTTKKTNSLLLGTIVLASAGVLSRIIGFLYRIFLSRTIGASALGLYQLVFPIITLSYAISFAGIQTAISKYVAEGYVKDQKNVNNTLALRYLYSGLILSIALSLLCQFALLKYADLLALELLGDSRCASLLRILSFTILPASIHSCINGYYYGKKKTAVPAIGQLTEQIVRVASVYIMYLITLEENVPLTEVHATWGILFSELAGLLVSITALSFSTPLNIAKKDADKTPSFVLIASLTSVGSMAVPLTANQTLMHLFSSFENLLIPQKLQAYGCSAEDALSVYGVLSGMVLSVIFFPCVLTNSISVLLLPSVSEAQACQNSKKINRIILLSIRYGLVFGFVFTLLFLIFGNFIGQILFRNVLAGILIRKLSWLCPMMYVYSLLCSVLHGLGRAKSVLEINLLASGMRIAFLLFLVPRYGLSALLWGMLLSQLFSALAAIVTIYHSHSKLEEISI